MKTKRFMFKRTIALITLWIFLFSNASFALRPAAFGDRDKNGPSAAEATSEDEDSVSFAHGKFVVDFHVHPVFAMKPPYSIQEVQDRLIQLLGGSQGDLLRILPITGESGVYLSCRGDFLEGYKIVGRIDPERNTLKFDVYRDRKDNILHAEDEFVTGAIKYASRAQPPTPAIAAPQAVGIAASRIAFLQGLHTNQEIQHILTEWAKERIAKPAAAQAVDREAAGRLAVRFKELGEALTDIDALNMARSLLAEAQRPPQLMRSRAIVEEQGMLDTTPQRAAPPTPTSALLGAI